MTAVEPLSLVEIQRNVNFKYRPRGKDLSDLVELGSQDPGGDLSKLWNYEDVNRYLDNNFHLDEQRAFTNVSKVLAYQSAKLVKFIDSVISYSSDQITVDKEANTKSFKTKEGYEFSVSSSNSGRQRYYANINGQEHCVEWTPALAQKEFSRDRSPLNRYDFVNNIGGWKIGTMTRAYHLSPSAFENITLELGLDVDANPKVKFFQESNDKGISSDDKLEHVISDEDSSVVFKLLNTRKNDFYLESGDLAAAVVPG